MKKIFILALMLTICVFLPAQMDTKSITEKNTLPSSQEELMELSACDTGHYTYSVEDYFQKPKQSTFRFSPDGKYISYREK
ncbi:MAG: S9 family peptidase, partial [Candidatus Neomarinimicrobiota bacterium]